MLTLAQGRDGQTMVYNQQFRAVEARLYTAAGAARGIERNFNKLVKLLGADKAVAALEQAVSRLEEAEARRNLLVKKFIQLQAGETGSVPTL